MELTIALVTIPPCATFGRLRCQCCLMRWELTTSFGIMRSISKKQRASTRILSLSLGWFLELRHATRARAAPTIIHRRTSTTTCGIGSTNQGDSRITKRRFGDEDKNVLAEITLSDEEDSHESKQSSGNICFRARPDVRT